MSNFRPGDCAVKSEPDFNGANPNALYETFLGCITCLHPDDIPRWVARLKVDLRDVPQMEWIELENEASYLLLLSFVMRLHSSEVTGVYGAVEIIIDELETFKSYLASCRDVPYKQYLQTEHWRRVREAALVRAKEACQLCNSTKSLNVHHRTYERMFAERDEDVIVLCRHCHAKFHEKLP